MTRRSDVICIIDKTQERKPPAGALEAIAVALQHQLVYELCPAWRKYPTHVVVGEVPGAHPMVLVDDLGVAGALGYHDDGSDGPYSMIGVGVIIDNGGDWLRGSGAPDLSVSSVCSHEACEAVVDPTCRQWADDGQGTWWALEACDAVESESYINMQTGALLSNFVLPGYFDPSHNTPALDHMGTCATPFEVRPNGYAIVYSAGQINQVWGAHRGQPVPSRQARVGVRSKLRGATER